MYSQFLKGNLVRLKQSAVIDHVAEATQYISMKYHPVKRHSFESDENHFAQMLENYVTARQCGVINDGAGFRLRQ